MAAGSASDTVPGAVVGGQQLLIAWSPRFVFGCRHRGYIFVSALWVVEDMRSYFDAIHGRSFDLGIGLHYGTVIVGSVGWRACSARSFAL